MKYEIIDVSTGRITDPLRVASREEWIEGKIYYSWDGTLFKRSDNGSFTEHEDCIVVFPLDAPESMKE